MRIYIKICKKCGREFQSEQKQTTVCPDCRKRAVAEANERARLKKKLKEMGWDKLSDNMVAIRMKANEAFAAGLTYGQFHGNELIQQERKK